MKPASFDEVVRAVGMLGGLTVVSVAALNGHSEAALGAVMGFLAAAGGWFYRGKVEKTGG